MQYNDKRRILVFGYHGQWYQTPSKLIDIYIQLYMQVIHSNFFQNFIKFIRLYNLLLRPQKFEIEDPKILVSITNPPAAFVTQGTQLSSNYSVRNMHLNIRTVQIFTYDIVWLVHNEIYVPFANVSVTLRSVHSQSYPKTSFSRSPKLLLGLVHFMIILTNADIVAMMLFVLMPWVLYMVKAVIVDDDGGDHIWCDDQVMAALPENVS